MPINVIRADSRKSNGYGKSCHFCNETIYDKEYVARTKTRGTSFYHCLCAMRIHLIDNLNLIPFPGHSERKSPSRGLRKKFIFFGN